VDGQTQPAFVDFRPNDAKLHLSKEPKKDSQERRPDLPPGVLEEVPFDRDKYERLSQLPALLIEVVVLSAPAAMEELAGVGFLAVSACVQARTLRVVVSGTAEHHGF